MIKEIITVNTGLEILKTASTDVDVENMKEVFSLADDLLDTILGCGSRAAGLAANQIGITKRAFAMKWGADILIVINPVIQSCSAKRSLSKEGCLSRPGKSNIPVMRHKTITAWFFDITTETIIKKSFKGFDAIVFQHEFDHLNGKVI